MTADIMSLHQVPSWRQTNILQAKIYIVTSRNISVSNCMRCLFQLVTTRRWKVKGNLELMQDTFIIMLKIPISSYNFYHIYKVDTRDCFTFLFKEDTTVKHNYDSRPADKVQIDWICVMSGNPITWEPSQETLKLSIFFTIYKLHAVFK